MRGKKMKILCIAVGILLLVAVCVYCFRGKRVQTVQETGQKDRSVSYASIGRVSYSNIGCFYADDQSRLLYLDADSGKETVACAKAGCEHQSHLENKDTECAADIYGFDYSLATTIIQQGQYVYLLQYNEEELSDYVLYRQHTDGSERKKIMTLKDTDVLRPYYMVCDGQWLVITCDQSFQKDEKTGEMVNLNERDIVLVVVNLEQTTCSIYSVGEQCPKGSTECYVDSMSMDGDDLYFLCSYMDAGYQMEQAEKMDEAAAREYEKEHSQGNIWQFSLEKGTMQPAPALEKYKIDLARIEGSKVLFQSKEAQMIGYVDLSEKEEVMQVKEIQLPKDDIRLEGIVGEDLYYRNYDSANDSSTYYVYHRKTDVEETLPEPPEQYFLDYLSDKYVIFSVFDESGMISNNSGHIVSVSLQDFKEGNYTAKNGQQENAVGN